MTEVNATEIIVVGLKDIVGIGGTEIYQSTIPLGITTAIGIGTIVFGLTALLAVVIHIPELISDYKDKKERKSELFFREIIREELRGRKK